MLIQILVHENVFISQALYQLYTNFLFIRPFHEKFKYNIKY